MSILLFALFLTFVGCQSYSLVGPPSFFHRHSYGMMDPMRTKLRDALRIVTEKENYCLISTISDNEIHEGYPYGSVVGYSVDKNGFPILAIAENTQDHANISSHNGISLMIMDKNNLVNPVCKRVVITGNIRRIEDREEPYEFTYPSDDTLYYKKLYAMSHPNAKWIDFTDIHMYLLDDIKEIYYMEDDIKTYYSVEEYNRLFIH